MKKKGFQICGGRGFHITFPNGVTVLVQFGWGNYCRNYPFDDYDFKKVRNIVWGGEGSYFISEINAELGAKGSPDAEVAIFDKKGNWLTKKWKNRGDDVVGHCFPLDVLDALSWASKYKKRKKK